MDSVSVHQADKTLTTTTTTSSTTKRHWGRLSTGNHKKTPTRSSTQHTSIPTSSRIAWQPWPYRWRGPGRASPLRIRWNRTKVPRWNTRRILCKTRRGHPMGHHVRRRRILRTFNGYKLGTIVSTQSHASRPSPNTNTGVPPVLTRHWVPLPFGRYGDWVTIFFLPMLHIILNFISGIMYIYIKHDTTQESH